MALKQENDKHIKKPGRAGFLSNISVAQLVGAVQLFGWRENDC